MLLFGFCSSGAYADGGSSAPREDLRITSWQGAKNYGESFSISVEGGSPGGSVHFLTSNCAISPSTGSPGQSFTVTVQNAGTYSLTAIMDGDEEHAEVSDTKRGVGGRADQSPLTVDGWGNAKGYYRTFVIKVSGGSVQGDVTFQTDGCTVSPASGPSGSQFTVTVTRVGTYTLTAVMEGNRNYNAAYSAQQSGVACKADQPPIAISGWQESASYGDVFTVEISGGSTTENLSVTSTGCTVSHVSHTSYEVAIDTVGPYSLTAARAGNYGYNEVSAYRAGVSKKANQPDVSIAGWQNSKNLGDGFGIQLRGGASGGNVHFATSGCTVSPATGTTETTYFVTVSTVGEYTLIAYVDSNQYYNSANSREVKGTAQKAQQPTINVDNWESNASAGSSFDISLIGGGGTGATSITTFGGCSAVLKSPDGNAYTVTVTAKEGEPYGITVSKQGDASYYGVQEQRFDGVATQKGQTSLRVNGWMDAYQTGGSFDIQLAGGSGSGRVSFESEGCTVEPSVGDIDDIYTVTVTVDTGDAYSISVNRESDGIYARTSVLKSGSARPNVANLDASRPLEETETPLLDGGYDVWLLLGMVATLVILLSLALFLQYRDRQRRRRSRRYR